MAAPNMHEPDAASRHDPEPAESVTGALAESPWFWIVLFAGMALLALLVIGPKYGRRQARLELQFQTRAEVHARQLTADESPSPATNPTDGSLQVGVRWLIMIVAGLVCTAAVGLAFARRTAARRRSLARQASSSPLRESSP